MKSDATEPAGIKAAGLTRRPAREIRASVGILALGLAAALTLLVGWQREIARRYPVSDLPRVDRARIEGQVLGGNLNRTKALFYKVPDVRPDATEGR